MDQISSKLVRTGRSQTDARVSTGDIIEEFLVILAHDGLLVVAGDVVPCDAVVVHVVKYTQARLGGAVDVELGVVGLTLLLVASL